ncbi:MAG: hypothetical protein GEU86_09620 [Actinophytocola sp.]|nr:hypothetical protein [Actinophytocola sp.]
MTGNKERSRRTVIALGVIAAIMAAAAVTFGVLWWMAEDTAGPTEAETREVLDTAEKFAVDFSTFDYRSIEEHRAHVMSFSTPRWAKIVKDSVSSFDDMLVEGKAESKAKVHRRGIAMLADDKAEVLLFLDQEITNSNVPKPRIDRSRMVMTLAKVDGRWRLDRVDLD